MIHFRYNYISLLLLKEDGFCGDPASFLHEGPAMPRRSKTMKRLFLMCAGLLFFVSCSDDNGTVNSSGKVGWAIGYDQNNTAVILHTTDSGHTWREQGDRAEWEGHDGNDISAVDEFTAWAALAATDTTPGKILHTRDGGLTWEIQPIPEEVKGGIKGIKGLSGDEAWAASLEGSILHTVDGGQTWDMVPHPEVQINEVNRIDAVWPDDIWIADVFGGDTGMVHSRDGGQTWQHEYLPDDVSGNGPIGVSSVSPSVAWSAIRAQGDLYRTLDGGANWAIAAPNLSGANDFDDMCAVNADLVWAVLNRSGNMPGVIFRVEIEKGQVVKDEWTPQEYQFEGVTAFDGQTAWVVGYRARNADATLPEGIILHTQDGGGTWTSQTLPADDVALWKVSFVGGCR